MKREKSVNQKSTDVDKKSKDKKGLDASEGITYKPLCPEEIAKVTSSKGILSRKFHAYDLNAPHKMNLHIRGYMDYYGGYSEHTRNVVYGLHDTGKYSIRVANIKTPVDVDPITWQQNNWFIHNDIDVRDSKYLVIAGPGWLQKKYLPENRQIIGWTMIESMKFSDDCKKWLQNADYILCPTDIDIRRAKDAGCENIHKMRLGFDDKLYHSQVEPIELAGLEGRFVFGVLGSWNIRKGIKDIIKAYCSEFTSQSNTTLLLCCKYGNRKWGTKEQIADDERWTIQYEYNQIISEIKAEGHINLPHIALIDIPVHDTVLPHIMARFDCLVGFSSGESTWLPGIQAMHMKIPVIQLANDCCGYMEYLNDGNAFLCKDVKYEICSEEFWKTTSEYYEDQVFGYGNWEELADKMNTVFQCYTDDDVATMVTNAYLDSKEWTWDKAILNLDTFLQKV